MENVGAPPPPPQQDRSSWPSSSLHAPGKHMRKPIHRRTVDYTSTVVRYIQTRAWQRDVRDSTIIQPTPVSVTDMLPSVAYPDNPSMSFCTKFVHASTNKVRCSINKVLWTPTGRRLITGSQSGEFTLWNGQAFNFEMILQAHDEAIRSMVWSHNENWMVTGDDAGCIKYWQTNMNNVKANKSAHKESVRDLSFSSTDLKFCSCSDDKNVKVWDFARCQEERSLAGHGWDVKSVDWHPQKSLLVSGAKDSLVKLWDAKTGRELCTLHGHKNTVLSVRWNSNGNWVLTSSKDQLIKIYDIRTLKELESYRGHRKDVTCLAWHPFHEELFVSGSYDGAIIYWLVGHEFPQAEIQNAHENSVWDLAWHPMGHILCSGSNDHTTKFWCRNRPGEAVRENKGPPHLLGSSGEEAYFSGRPAVPLQANEGPTTPGAFVSGGPVRGEGNIPGVGIAMPFAQPVVDTAMMVDSSRPLPPPPQSVLNLVHSGGMIRGPHPPSAPHPSTLNNSSQPILYQQQLQLSLPQPQQQMMMQQPQPPLPPPRPIQPPLPPHPPPSVSNESNMSYPGMMPSSAPHMSGQIPFHGQPMLGVTSLHQGDYMQGPGGGMQVDMGGGQTFRTSGSGLQIQMPNLMGSLGLGSATYQAMPVPPMQQVSHTFQGSSMQGVMDNRGMMTNSGGLQMGLNVPRGPAPGQ